jgi:hypothetical protein
MVQLFSFFQFFGVRPVFPYWCRGFIFGATCRVILQCFRASWVCLYYHVFHVFDVTQCVAPLYISYASGRVVSGESHHYETIV